MNKQIFYRNKGTNSQEFRKHASKLSMDDLRINISKPPSELKKINKRNSGDHFDFSKMERSTFKKQKMNSSVTVSNSILATKNNSPVKFSLKNSQIFIQEPENKIKLWKFYYQIGFGGFGRVWKVAHKEDMKQFAMKQISKRRVIQKNNVESVINERKILSILQHPFLINMKCSFQDPQNLYLVMDYLRGGDLRYHICYKEKFSEKQIKFLTACILLGLQYIHKNHIIHKDLKPQNIVFEENGYVRITDFGIAKHEIGDGSLFARNQSSGTPVYMAPQILFKKEYSYQSDFYALGVMIYELAIGKRPFDGKNRSEIRQEIISKDIKLSHYDLPQGWSPSLADLINRLLCKNASERLGKNGIKQIKQHSFFVDMKWKKLQKKQIKPPFIPNVVCETKEYLDEIALFNQMNNQNNENQPSVSKDNNQKFKEYDFDRQQKKNGKKYKMMTLKKGRKTSQKKIFG